MLFSHVFSMSMFRTSCCLHVTRCFLPCPGCTACPPWVYPIPVTGTTRRPCTRTIIQGWSEVSALTRAQYTGQSERRNVRIQKCQDVTLSECTNGTFYIVVLVLVVHSSTCSTGRGTLQREYSSTRRKAIFQYWFPTFLLQNFVLVPLREAVQYSYYYIFE